MRIVPLAARIAGMASTRACSLSVLIAAEPGSKRTVAVGFPWPGLPLRQGELSSGRSTAAVIVGAGACAGLANLETGTGLLSTDGAAGLDGVSSFALALS